MSKKTVEQIIESGNDYTIQVKGNQPSLFKQIQQVMVEQTPLDQYDQQQKDHGRDSNWTTTVYDASQSDKAQEWRGLKRFIHVHKITRTKDKVSESNRVYITSRADTCAKYHHTGIRGHWTIENSLHWVKDVVHKEDNNGIRTNNGSINSSIFSSIAINIHRKRGYHSITQAQIVANANFNELFK